MNRSHRTPYNILHFYTHPKAPYDFLNTYLHDFLNTYLQE